MKSLPIWFFTLLALVVMNLQIYTKEQTLKDGQTVLLELVPVDPRSLMQGDYMQLKYAISGEVKGDLDNKGTIVLKMDNQQRGTFLRIGNADPLADDEQRLVYRNRNGVRLGAESFFFEEDTAELYEKAKYGELKVDQDGNSVLVGLRDETMTPLKEI